MKVKNIVIKVFLVICGLSFAFPILWMALTSLKADNEVYHNPLGLPEEWLFSNYPNAIKAFDFFRYVLNSSIYTLGTIVLTVACACLFAYAAARMKWKFSRFLMQYVQLGLLIPTAVVILSLYILLRDMHLKNTYMGIILVFTAGNIPFASLVLYGYFRSLPFELEESAFIDGSGVFRTFFSIIFPMITPAVVTLVIVIFMSAWNEFFVSYIVIDDMKMRTIPVALQAFSSLRGTQWGLLGAALVVTSIPTLAIYLLGSEKIEDAISTTGIIK